MDLRVPDGRLGIVLTRRVFDKETGLVIPVEEIDYEAESADAYSDDEGESRRPDSKIFLTQMDPRSFLQTRMAIGDEVTHVNNILLSGMTRKEYRNIIQLIYDRRKTKEGLPLTLKVDPLCWKEARKLKKSEEDKTTRKKKRPYNRASSKRRSASASARVVSMTSSGRAPLPPDRRKSPRTGAGADVGVATKKKKKTSGWIEMEDWKKPDFRGYYKRLNNPTGDPDFDPAYDPSYFTKEDLIKIKKTLKRFKEEEELCLQQSWARIMEGDSDSDSDISEGAIAYRKSLNLAGKGSKRWRRVYKKIKNFNPDQTLEQDEDDMGKKKPPADKSQIPRNIKVSNRTRTRTCVSPVNTQEKEEDSDDSDVSEEERACRKKFKNGSTKEVWKTIYKTMKRSKVVDELNGKVTSNNDNMLVSPSTNSQPQPQPQLALSEAVTPASASSASTEWGYSCPLSFEKCHLCNVLIVDKMLPFHIKLCSKRMESKRLLAKDGSEEE